MAQEPWMPWLKVVGVPTDNPDFKKPEPVDTSYPPPPPTEDPDELQRSNRSIE